MKKYKITCIVLLFMIICIPGILKVNFEYNKNSKREPSNELRISSDAAGSTVKYDMYNEIKLFRKNSGRLEAAYSFNPFDLRISLGDYIFYINGNTWNNIAEGAGSTLNKEMGYFERGLENLRDAGGKVVDAVKGKAGK